MMSTPRFAILAALLAASLWLAPPAQARRGEPLRPGPAAGERYLQGRSARTIGRDQAAAAVARATGGRVLGVSGGEPAYEVKVLLPGGRVRVIGVDAHSGRLLD